MPGGGVFWTASVAPTVTVTPHMVTSRPRWARVTESVGCDGFVGAGVPSVALLLPCALFRDCSPVAVSPPGRPVPLPAPPARSVGTPEPLDEAADWLTVVPGMAPSR